MGYITIYFQYECVWEWGIPFAWPLKNGKSTRGTLFSDKPISELADVSPNLSDNLNRKMIIGICHICHGMYWGYKQHYLGCIGFENWGPCFGELPWFSPISSHAKIRQMDQTYLVLTGKNMGGWRSELANTGGQPAEMVVVLATMCSWRNNIRVSNNKEFIIKNMSLNIKNSTWVCSIINNLG